MTTWKNYMREKHMKEKYNKARESINSFTDSLELECARQRRLRKQAKDFLETAPRGSLLIKPRKKGSSYYWNIDEKKGGKRSRRQFNINDNPQMIHVLLEKRFQKEIEKRCDGNLKILEKLMNRIQPIESSVIKDSLPRQYQEIFRAHSIQKVAKWQQAPYSKAPVDPHIHVHETDCGILVRSKSEQLLANSLYACGIPFHYEEELVHQTGIRRRVYPDFTIMLPDGKIILWEHFGLLSNRNYCEDTTLKLQIFQLSGYTIGKNLLLTMDDSRGDCSSMIINETIKTKILPHFQ